MALRIIATDDLWSRYTSVAPWGWAAFWVLLVLMIGTIGWFLYRRVSKSLGGRSHAEMMMLKGLDESNAMTEEERKKVRAALARKYMQSVEEPAKSAANMSPLQQLALEARQLEEQARLKAGQKSQTEALPPQPPPEESREEPREEPRIEPMSPTSSAPPSDLPPMLRKLISKSDIELEDMVAAGLIGEEDLEWVRRARGGQS